MIVNLCSSVAAVQLDSLVRLVPWCSPEEYCHLYLQQTQLPLTISELFPFPGRLWPRSLLFLQLIVIKKQTPWRPLVPSHTCWDKNSDPDLRKLAINALFDFNPASDIISFQENFTISNFCLKSGPTKTSNIFSLLQVSICGMITSKASSNYLDLNQFGSGSVWTMRLLWTTTSCLVAVPHHPLFPYVWVDSWTWHFHPPVPSGPLGDAAPPDQLEKLQYTTIALRLTG